MMMCCRSVVICSYAFIVRVIAVATIVISIVATVILSVVVVVVVVVEGLEDDESSIQCKHTTITVWVV